MPQTIFIADRVKPNWGERVFTQPKFGYELVKFKVKKTVKGDEIPKTVTGWLSTGRSICPRYFYFDEPIITVIAQAPDKNGNVGIVRFFAVTDPEFIKAP